MYEVESLLSVLIFVFGLLAALFIAEYREERREEAARRKRRRTERLQAAQLADEVKRVEYRWNLEAENKQLKHRVNQKVTVKRNYGEFAECKFNENERDE